MKVTIYDSNIPLLVEEYPIHSGVNDIFYYVSNPNDSMILDEFQMLDGYAIHLTKHNRPKLDEWEKNKPSASDTLPDIYRKLRWAYEQLMAAKDGKDTK